VTEADVTAVLTVTSIVRKDVFSEKMMEKKQTWRSITISARDAGSAPGSAAKEP
jgi:hypothetical protein